jgi:DNA-3-methyladenine glycosylase
MKNPSSGFDPRSLVPIPKTFYEVTPLQLAKKLIGTLIVRDIGYNRLVAKIVETEAYGGGNDPASHAYGGKTERNAVMFRSGGYGYVYFTYGMHFCFNVVSGRRDGEPGAVLIRAAEPLAGTDLMRKNRNKENLRDLLSGPAKLCEALEITRTLNGISLDGPPLFFAYSTDRYRPKLRFTHRIGIKNGREKIWRVIERGNKFISVKLETRSTKLLTPSSRFSDLGNTRYIDSAPTELLF